MPGTGNTRVNKLSPCAHGTSILEKNLRINNIHLSYLLPTSTWFYIVHSGNKAD